MSDVNAKQAAVALLARLNGEVSAFKRIVLPVHMIARGSGEIRPRPREDSMTKGRPWAETMVCPSRRVATATGRSALSNAASASVSEEGPAREPPRGGPARFLRCMPDS